jgi:hypothetical protein
MMRRVLGPQGVIITGALIIVVIPDDPAWACAIGTGVGIILSRLSHA